MSPDRSRQARGRFGEDLAARWYAERGWEILARNWRPPGRGAGELDLVVRNGEVVAFVEVKARRSGAYGLPVEAVGPDKRARIRRLAGAWLSVNGDGRRRVRFDVVSVLGTEIEVIEDAF